MASNMVYKGSRLKVKLTVKDDICLKAPVIRKYNNSVHSRESTSNQPKSVIEGNNDFAGEIFKNKGITNAGGASPPNIWYKMIISLVNFCTSRSLYMVYKAPN